MAANKNPNEAIAIACGLNPRYPGIFMIKIKINCNKNCNSLLSLIKLVNLPIALFKFNQKQGT